VLAARTPERSSALPLPESLSFGGIISGELLRSAPDLRLEREVAGALNWSKKSRQVLLLRLHQCDALFLQTQRVVQQRTHVLLVRLISGGHLNSQHTPGLSLLHHELILLWGESSIGLGKLRELRVGETEPLLRHLG
jgi:hypothetical protein